MARGSINRLTTGAASGSAALEIIAGADRGFWLRELFVTLAAATTSVYGVGRPAAKGVTPTSPVRLLPEDGVDLAANSPITAATALAWATPPTAPTSFYRQASLPATIGAQVWWTFENLFVPAGSTIVLWNGAANSVAYVDVVCDMDAKGL
jgi:hypothetical protein